MKSILLVAVLGLFLAFASADSTGEPTLGTAQMFFPGDSCALFCRREFPFDYRYCLRTCVLRDLYYGVFSDGKRSADETLSMDTLRDLIEVIQSSGSPDDLRMGIVASSRSGISAALRAARDADATVDGADADADSADAWRWWGPGYGPYDPYDPYYPYPYPYPYRPFDAAGGPNQPMPPPPSGPAPPGGPRSRTSGAAAAGGGTMSASYVRYPASPSGYDTQYPEYLGPLPFAPRR